MPHILDHSGNVQHYAQTISQETIPPMHRNGPFPTEQISIHDHHDSQEYMNDYLGYQNLLFFSDSVETPFHATNPTVNDHRKSSTDLSNYYLGHEHSLIDEKDIINDKIPNDHLYNSNSDTLIEASEDYQEPRRVTSQSHWNNEETKALIDLYDEINLKYSKDKSMRLKTIELANLFHKRYPHRSISSIRRKLDRLKENGNVSDGDNTSRWSEEETQELIDFYEYHYERAIKEKSPFILSAIAQLFHDQHPQRNLVSINTKLLKLKNGGKISYGGMFAKRQLWTEEEILELIDFYNNYVHKAKHEKIPNSDSQCARMFHKQHSFRSVNSIVGKLGRLKAEGKLVTGEEVDMKIQSEDNELYKLAELCDAID